MGTGWSRCAFRPPTEGPGGPEPRPPICRLAMEMGPEVPSLRPHDRSASVSYRGDGFGASEPFPGEKDLDQGLLLELSLGHTLAGRAVQGPLH